MDASDSGGGGAAAAAADVGGPLWDWDNLLNFAIENDDSLVLPWDTPLAPEADPAVTAPFPTPAPLHPADAEPAQHPPPPPQPPAVGGGSRRGVRKRDPRLVCPNYLAGIVPCACPELDEMAAAAEVEEVAAEMLAGPRKRSRAAAPSRGTGAAARSGAGTGAAGRGGAADMRCQVPGCEADIRELKGYHKRHRVCLGCAHASAVMLDSVQKRYCQQCGKFHVLLDFDDDKRSCRRKLERHNKRRRRKPDSKDTLEKETDEQLDLSADGSGGGELREEDIDGATCNILETILSNNVIDRETPVGSEDMLSSPTCTQSSLQNDQSKSIVTFAASVEACIGTKHENAKLNNSPVHDTKSTYSSSCPTGRISFKLYDWNPAEFPRRLRNQIFEWLSSMPVELEGYIRPGCTILTVFIAMPQHMWDKLSEDAANLVRDLVNAPSSLLLGKGAFFVHVNNTIFQVLKDGATLMSTRLEVQAPRIHYVHPAWFEAGKPIELLVCGSSLDQPKFRSLLSFDGEYLKHDCCRLTSRETLACVKSGDPTLDPQHEFFQINITQTKPDNHGPGFVEVENVFGLSNFVPILFGSKQLCFELERIQDALCGFSHKHKVATSDPEHRELQQTAMSGFLIEIGWLIRKPSPDEFKNLLSKTNIKRWICVLKFLIQNNFINVLEIVVQSSENIIGSEILSNLERGKLERHVTTFLGYLRHARNILNHRAQQNKETQLETALRGDITSNQPNWGTSVPLGKENVGASSEFSLHSPTNVECEEEESVPLVTNKAVSPRQCCRPEMNIRWLNPASVASMPGGAMRMRLVTTMVVAAVLCFTACVAVFHPDRVGVLAAPVKRYLFSDCPP
ncbi:squamosa promoter-binding-like protein 9 [Lolium rigidum]|uniref:squamosa promoter-binding-like protein 9 n=1 Tax=Lolium rigidum TaxID=89674 RepID=UPI001F5C1C63|nr:squamosa promoter-binding-like protein 9 [Lolium rigidum]